MPTGLGTLFDPNSGGASRGYIAFALIQRFQGLDYNSSITWIVQTELRNRTRIVRTTNWLSIIDDEFVRQLGGIDKIRTELSVDCSVHIYDGGMIIQAGKHAELGDINKGHISPNYRHVANTLKLLLFEDYKTGLFFIYEPYDSFVETKKWINCFNEDLKDTF